MVINRDLPEMKSEIDKMIEDRRATRLINPVLTLFYLREFQRTGNRIVRFNLVKPGYEETVCDLIRNHLHHNFNIGGQFNDSYLQRLASRHRVFEQITGKDFAINPELAQNHESLIPYIIHKIDNHLQSKLLNLVRLEEVIKNNSREELREILEDPTSINLREFLQSGFEPSAASFLSVAYGFEICMFSILKVLLAKFGCKIYRDSKTYSSDKGTDLGTNFGVVYQVKKKCITSENAFDELVRELLLNFANGRIEEGNVFVIVEDMDDGFRARLKAQRINCMTQKTVTDFLDKLDAEDKWEILQQITQEFKRELMSDVCRACKKLERETCPYSL
jgi:hypothetical protein